MASAINTADSAPRPLRGVDMLSNDITGSSPLRDLDLRAARPNRRLPHEHDIPGPYRASGCVTHPNRTPLTSTNVAPTDTRPSDGTSRVRAFTLAGRTVIWAASANWEPAVGTSFEHLTVWAVLRRMRFVGDHVLRSVTS